MEKTIKKDLRQRELDTILKFSALINSSLNIEDVLNHAMQWAEEFMNAEASTVYELDEKTGNLFVRIARGEKKGPAKGIKLQVGEGIAGRVVQTGKPMVIQDVGQEKRFSDKFDRMTGFKTRAMVCVPLTLRDKPIGALQVLNKKTHDSFTHADIELLTSMSQQIAVALDNAKLYSRLEKKFELTTLELKVVQERLIRSERLAAMGNLVQGVAHEIRNPITTIGGFAKRIKRVVKKDPKLDSYADIILEETQRLENLVSEVRKFADVLSATLTLEDITKILEQVRDRFEPIAKTQGVTFMTDIAPDLPFTMMDPDQIAAALFHIIKNAFESMPHGGKLLLSAKQSGEKLHINITDTGCGIGQYDLDAIYDPFFTSKTRGAGLGLTMVHQIIMNHEGDIRTNSEEGKGTSVRILLPIRG